MSQTAQKPTILIVEDEPDLRRGLQHNLELEGFRVAAAADGEQGLQQLSLDPPSLLLLDLMLPGMSGIEVLRHIREQGQPTPVIILSAKGQDRDKVEGLELGADDYVTKPFGLAELTARIRAVLRRTGSPRAEPVAIHCFPDLVVDFRSFTVERNGRRSQLSRYEAEILRLLIARKGEVVSRRDLLTEVWGYVHLPTTRTVDNHIARLRKKVEADVENPVHILTVHGIGYRFACEDQA